MLPPRAHLIACAACGCHARADEDECPSCGAALRRADGSVPRSAAAVLLGLAAVATCAAAACGSEVRGSGGAGPGSDESSSVASTYSAAMAVSTYGVGPTGPATSTGTGGADCGDLILADPACEDCALSACCVELGACALGTPCGDLALCIASCADQACIDQCYSDLPGGVAELDALEGCLAAQCGSECGESSICDSGLTMSNAACDTCLGTICCAEFESCTQNGADLQPCIDCFDAGGGPLCDAAIACFDANCATECM